MPYHKHSKIDKKTGRFVRYHKIWNERRWNDGFIGVAGRFLVYYPKSSRPLYQGYAFRHHVVYERRTGKKIPKHLVIHHKNGDKTDDRFKNLQLLTKKQHDKLHTEQQKIRIKLKCVVCNKSFEKPKWRMKWDHVGLYCSRKCFYNRGYNHDKNANK